MWFHSVGTPASPICLRQSWVQVAEEPLFWQLKYININLCIVLQHMTYTVAPTELHFTFKKAGFYFNPLVLVFEDGQNICKTLGGKHIQYVQYCHMLQYYNNLNTIFLPSLANALCCYRWQLTLLNEQLLVSELYLIVVSQLLCFNVILTRFSLVSRLSLCKIRDTLWTLPVVPMSMSLKSLAGSNIDLFRCWTVDPFFVLWMMTNTVLWLFSNLNSAGMLVCFLYKHRALEFTQCK